MIRMLAALQVIKNKSRLYQPLGGTFSAAPALQMSSPNRPSCRVPGPKMIMNQTTTPTRSVGSTAKRYLASAALALTLVAIPQIGYAQGIVRGAQEGAYEGDRVAGTIGG